LTKTGHTKTPKALITESLGAFVRLKLKKRLSPSLSPRGVYAPKGARGHFKIKNRASIKTLSSSVLYKKYIDNKKR
jgi:hypothetical protein